MRAIALLLLAGCATEAAPTDVASPAPDPAAACLAGANAPRERLTDPPGVITVRHVLVKHRDADRAPEGLERRREAACLRAVEALEALKEGADFDAVVARFSDEEGAASRGGMIGEIRADEVAPAFADAAFALDVGQISHVVETPFGFHLILRER